MATRAAKVGVWELRPDEWLTLAVDPVLVALLGYTASGQPDPLSLWLGRLAPQDRDRLRRESPDRLDAPALGGNCVLRLRPARDAVVSVPGPGRDRAQRGGAPGGGDGGGHHRTQAGRRKHPGAFGPAPAGPGVERCIARDLHDNVARDLSSLKIAYETLLDGLPDVDDTVRTRLEASSTRWPEPSPRYASWLTGCARPQSGTSGLDLALRRLCQDAAKASSAAVSYAGVGLDGLDIAPDVAINVYRIARKGWPMPASTPRPAALMCA